MFSFLQYFSGLFLGWGLGANDTANVFGTAVSSRMVSYRLAVILTAVFVLLGALWQGEAGIRTLSEGLNRQHAGEPANQARERAILVSLGAALTVLAMTRMRVPVSTSQAVVGAIIGVGLMEHNVNFGGLGKVVACWFGTPVGAALLTLVFHRLLRWPVRRWKPSVFVYDPVVTILLVVTGAYGAYALGANNVANVSAVFVGEGMLTVREAALFGGLSIVIGTVTYSRPVMMTVGRGIVRLDAFTALVTVLAHAVTVHIYAMVGVPVSTSQAIVGAVLGVGLIKGMQTVNLRMLGRVAAGWTATPFIAAAVTAALFFLAHLRYSPAP
jgi:PiT family inorganic phosphate transporter